MKLSIIIPTYNESQRIKKTLLAIDEYLRRQSYDSQILIANDGSTDSTVRIVEQLQSRIHNLIILKNAQNHGKGFVVREGMLKATGEYRLFLDADNSTSLSAIEAFLKIIGQGSDVVIGSRALPSSRVTAAQPPMRWLLGKLFHATAALVAGCRGFYDTQCGFKMFSAAAAQNIFSRCALNSFSFDVEALVVAQKLGYKITEVPVEWKNDRHSTVSFSRMAAAMRDLFLIRSLHKDLKSSR